MKAIAPQLYTSPDAVCDWENIDVIRQNKYFRRFDRKPPNTSSIPTSRTCRGCRLRSPQQLRILPCGSAANCWGGLASGVDLVVSTERLNSVIQHAVGDLLLEAGTKFADLRQF